MTARRINHVSVSATDLEESVRFYEELFGMERIPTPRFQEEVVWLRLGDQQLHLFLRGEGEPPYRHHFALDVDDFDSVYRAARERGLLDSQTFHQPIRAHPRGWVQMYVRDPDGNLVEVDWPDVSTLAADVQSDCGRLEDEVAQTGEASRASLYT